ncbi:MAG: flagellar basal body-associated FliL family protein [Pacificimonas sp.]
MSASEKDENGSAPTGGLKGMIIKIALAVSLIVAAASGTFFAISAGLIGGADAADEEVETAPPERSYFEFARAFTFNEPDGRRLIQVNITLSTEADEAFAGDLVAHEPALRAAALDVLMNATREDITEPVAQRALREKLQTTIDAEIERRSGSRGVEEVFFTDVIVQ